MSFFSFTDKVLEGKAKGKVELVVEVNGGLGGARPAIPKSVTGGEGATATSAVGGEEENERVMVFIKEGYFIAHYKAVP